MLSFSSMADFFSYDNYTMLAAIAFLAMVVLFITLLRLCASHLLSAEEQSFPSPRVSHHHRHHHHFNLVAYDISTLAAAAPPTRGLDDKVIASIPLFVYGSDVDKEGLECAVCLSVFEDGEVGRRLPSCCHVFHVECIDMWLRSHSTCPVCRAPVVVKDNCGGGHGGGRPPTNDLRIIISNFERAGH
ncbi:hypothetical protein Ancab_010726 [Ancistrocladus abbreviatus]